MPRHEPALARTSSQPDREGALLDVPDKPRWNNPLDLSEVSDGPHLPPDARGTVSGRHRYRPEI